MDHDWEKFFRLAGWAGANEFLFCKVFSLSPHHRIFKQLKRICRYSELKSVDESCKNTFLCKQKLTRRKGNFKDWISIEGIWKILTYLTRFAETTLVTVSIQSEVAQPAHIPLLIAHFSCFSPPSWRFFNGSLSEEDLYHLICCQCLAHCCCFLP